MQEKLSIQTNIIDEAEKYQKEKETHTFLDAEKQIKHEKNSENEYELNR